MSAILKPDDEQGEVEALPADASQAERDAFASDLLRREGEALRELAEREAGLNAEIARLRMRYTLIFDRLRARAAYFNAATCALALQSDFLSTRSRTVGNGKYGVRRVPDKVVIVDEKAALAWAKEHDCTRTKTIESIDKALLDSAAWLGTTPDGCRIEPAHDVPFASPDEV